MPLVHDGGGQPLEANFGVTGTGEGTFVVTIESRSGRRGGPEERNTDYMAGLDLILARLTHLDGVLLDAVLDTAQTRNLSADERRLDLGRAYPIRLSDTDSDELAKLMARAQQIGRRPGAKGTGNQTRRIALTVGVTDVVGDMSQLESSLQHGSTHLDPGLPDDAGSTWIFQSKPETYDLASALASLGTLTWLVNQHPKDIHAGDRVYLWESGWAGGILAVAHVLDEPAMLEEAEAEKVFWVKPEDAIGSSLRVHVAIDRVLPRRLFRDDIKQDSDLADLSILKFSNSTNFPVTPKQDQALRSMIGELDAPRYYVLVTSPKYPDTWARCKELASWGSPHRSRLMMGVAAGDGLLLYKGGTGFVATATATGGYHRVEPTVDNEWGNGDVVYPHRFPLEPVRDYPEPLVPDFPKTTPDPEFGIATAQLKGGFFRITLSQYEAIAQRLEEINAHVTSPRRPPMTFAELLERTLWEEARLRQLVDAVQEGTSPQVALAGPPGTGKTFIAKLIAEYVTGGRSGAVTMVQFHPSYAYEQFVEGLRPVAKGGAISFEVVPGKVLSVTAGMGRDHGVHVMVIDEMNRANLPKVFGELMYLFEYRESAIDLQYSPGFSLPANLRFIGTMNTADRSIRSIDVALRRRFDIFDFPPDSGVLARHYERVGHSEVSGLVEGFERLNEVLSATLDPHHTIGHAFLMAKVLDADRLRFIWTHKIAPLVEEYFFDQPDIAAQYRLERFWPSIG